MRLSIVVLKAQATLLCARGFETLDEARAVTVA